MLYYKYLLVLLRESDYEHHFNETDQLSPSQQQFATAQLKLFRDRWQDWPGRSYAAV